MRASWRRRARPWLLALLILHPGVGAADGQRWLRQDRGDFRFIYPERLSHLVPTVAGRAEVALAALSRLFHYRPSEPIVLVLRDGRDADGRTATTLPHNRVELEVAPLDLDYEFARYGDHHGWLTSHELTHVVVGDQAARRERTLRGWLGKVAPVSPEPVSVPFALLTSPGRMTPLWHQEGVAVFMETWLNGGLGRVLGAFDEMYFRTLVASGDAFPARAALDFADDDSFLLSTGAYLLGSRFIAELAAEHGVDTLLGWLRAPADALPLDFPAGFKRAFGVDLDTAWRDFERRERAHQQANLARLAVVPFTPVQPLTALPAAAFGWVGRPHLHGGEVLFARHAADALAAVVRLDLGSGRVERLADLPTPRLVEVAQTALDPAARTLWFTVQNDRGYRDLRRVGLEDGRVDKVRANVRITSMTVEPGTGVLWAVASHNGGAVLMRGEHPAAGLETVTLLAPGVVLGHLAMAPTGAAIAATLHRPSGLRELILIDPAASRTRGTLVFRSVSTVGSPEHPSWSPDGRTLYWNAYASGVSNLFRLRLADGGPEAEPEPLTHVPDGLFHPLWLAPGRLFAFRFTPTGFAPVSVAERPVAALPAIVFAGQRALARNPELRDWALPPDAPPNAQSSAERRYCGLCALRLDTLVPTLSDSSGQPMPGLFAQFTDLLNRHRVLLRLGAADAGGTQFGLSYEYLDQLELRFEHRPSSFYDVFNARPAERDGWYARIAGRHWWLDDRPTTVSQWLSLDWEERALDPTATGVATTPGLGRFLTLGTALEAVSLRRSIGAVDDEVGWRLDTSAELPVDLDGGDQAWRLALAASVLRPVGHPHNIVRLSVAGGVQGGAALGGTARFRLGGFGNQALEPDDTERFREPESLPGLPYRSLPAERFLKVAVEDQTPPLRLGRRLGFHHYAEDCWANLFLQGVALNDGAEDSRWLSAGVQVNLGLWHYFTLESTLSAGLAYALSDNGEQDTGAFLSWKLFR